MAGSLFISVAASEEAPIILAALRSNMLKLAAEKASGAHPYFVTPQHTARAREIMGPKAMLCPEQMVLLEADPDRARAIARKHMATYISLPNYCNNLLELGFTEQDYADEGSDKLVDAIVAWGDKAAIRARIQAHWDAGADHVCIQALRNDGEMGPDESLLEILAPAHH